MRTPPSLLVAIALMCGACGVVGGTSEAQPAVVVTTTTTTTIAAAPASTTTTTAEVPVETAPSSTSSEVAGTNESTTTTVAESAAQTTPAEAERATFCTTLAGIQQSNPFAEDIETRATAYASYIAWEIDQLLGVRAPEDVAADFASYIEAERRTLEYVEANVASVSDLRALGSSLNARLGIEDVAADVGRYLTYLREHCPQF
jgi:hypothetical protein